MIALHHVFRRAVFGSGHAQLLRAAHDVVHRVLRHPFADMAVDFIASAAALQRVVQGRIERPCGTAKQLHEATPLAVFKREQFHIAVERLEHAAVAKAPAGAVFERSVAQPLQRERAHREHRVLHRHIDELPTHRRCRPPCGQRAHRRHAAALIAAEVTVDLERRTIGKQLVGQAVGQQKALAPRMQQIDLFRAPVRLVASRAKREHAHMHQMRKDRCNAVGIEPQCRALRHGRVVDEDVGVAQHLHERSARAVAFQIADHAALAKRQVGEQRALARVFEQRRSAAQFRAFGRFQHHHFRAHRREQPARIRDGNRARTLYDPAAREGQFRHSPLGR